MLDQFSSTVYFEESATAVYTCFIFVRAPYANMKLLMKASFSPTQVIEIIKFYHIDYC